MNNAASIKRQFLNSLKRGTGEAYLLVRDNPGIDFSNLIIKGVLNIYAYDGQCESDRAQYIFDIISISKQQEEIRKALLQGLATEQNDTWNLTHLFALAKLYAQQNDIEAKQAIYDRFLTNPIEGSDWVGAYEILELDGLNGLFYVAEKFGKYIEQNPDDVQDDWIIRRFQEENEHIKVAEELEERAKTNKFIRIYLDNIERTKATQEKYKVKPTKYKDIVDEVLNTKPFVSFSRVRNLTNDEVNLVAQQLIREKDKSNVEKLLSVFNFHKFPYDSQIILDFAKQKPTSKNRIVEYAIDALQHLKSEDIRKFALDKIQTTKNPIDYLVILVSNYHRCQLASLPFTSFLSHKGYRLVVQRTLIKDEQSTLFDSYIYRSILTNDTISSEEEIVRFYNQRGCSEQTFDKMNNDFGWSHLPCSFMMQNVVFMIFTAIIMNFYTALMLKLSQKDNFQREFALTATSRLKRFIFRIIQVPFKWVHGDKQWILQLFTTRPYDILQT